MKCTFNGGGEKRTSEKMLLSPAHLFCLGPAITGEELAADAETGVRPPPCLAAAERPALFADRALGVDWLDSG